MKEANLGRANLEEAKNCIPDQIKDAKNWDKARYSLEFCQQLGLPPEPCEADKGKS